MLFHAGMNSMTRPAGTQQPKIGENIRNSIVLSEYMEMDKKIYKKNAPAQSSEEQLFEKIYGQETGLPGELKGTLHIVSCIAFREEQQVYLAEDEAGRKSILKRAEGSQKQLLKREADSLEHLRFSFLPAFLSRAESEGSVWLQREYIPGDTLWELVEKKGPFSPEQAGAIMCRLCIMTAQLHESQPPVIHRDLKPQNIILTPEENLFLIDLGTVREYRRDAQHDTLFVGTRSTAAPEQYGYHQTDCRTDIYALGVIYLYLLTGSMELQKPETRKLVSEACMQIIETCTSFNPDDRYQSCRDLWQAILQDGDRRLSRQETADTGAGTRSLRLREQGQINPARTAFLQKRRAPTAVLILIVILAGAGGLGYLRYQYGPYEFHSDLIGQAVRLQLGKEESDPVSRAELAQIETLRICGSRILADSDKHRQNCSHHYINEEENETTDTISDISDCVWMKRLHTLVLDSQQITDISALEKLPLQEVSLCDNPIADLSPLSESGDIKTLSLEETQVQDLSPLSGLSGLTWLDIGNTGVKELKPLEDMGIETLKMASVYPTDQEVLQTLPLKKLMVHSASNRQEELIGEIETLQELTIYNYRHTTLDPLKNLTKLFFLDLYGGEISSLEGSKVLKDLHQLIIGRTRISDLSPLKENGKLNYIGLEGTPVTDFSVLKELKEFQWLGCSESQKKELDRQISDPAFEIEVYEDAASAE